MNFSKVTKPENAKVELEPIFKSTVAMNANLGHKNWQQKLNQWLTGDANRRDEAHLDEMAQQDPFLADAMEGYRATPTGQHARNVTRLKAKLRQQNRTEKGLPWMKIAAVGAFLILALFGLREYNQSVNHFQNIAKQETTSTPSISPTHPENQKTITNQPTSQQKPELIKKEELASKKASGKNKAKFQQPSPTPSEKPNSPSNDFALTLDHSGANAGSIEKEEQIEEYEAPEMAFAEKQEMPNVEANKDSTVPTPPVAAKTTPPSPLDEEAFDKAYEPIILSNDTADFADKDDAATEESTTYIGRVVKGKVLSEGGEPLIGANVNITGTPAGTVTDIDGDFTLNVPPDNTTIDIHYVGYEDVRVDLANQNDIRINMESAQTNLSEVAITSQALPTKKAKKRKGSAADLAEENIKIAAPKIGFDKFEQYIKDNIQLSENETEESDFETVIVQFKVRKNGTLSDFKIIQSVSVECDAEAIRLLKEGPKWETTINTVTSYSIDCK